jgi:plastocyanin
MMRWKSAAVVAVITASLGACGAGKDQIGPGADPAKVAPAPAAPASPAPAAAATPTPAGGAIEIAVTTEGFQPDKIAVKKGERVTFAFTRKTDETCAKQVVIQVSPTEKIEKQLPLNERVEVTTTFPNSGDVKYACGMDMITGVISVQ